MNLKEIAEKHLATWPLHEPDKHKVSIRDISGGVWLGYRTTPGNRPQGTTYFDVNVVKGVFFILDVSLETQHRGKGQGAALYKLLEVIAAEAGCHKVQMTASGTTHTGESRMDYLLRRGYTEFGIEVVKNVWQDREMICTWPNKESRTVMVTSNDGQEAKILWNQPVDSESKAVMGCHDTVLSEWLS